jgi:glycosyltransferase involved in cell wall biosynthesis
MSEPADGSAVTATRAAFAVASRAELAAVRLLARAYRHHHPGHRFFVVMVEGEGVVSGEDAESFETIALEQIELPHRDLFAIEQDTAALRSALAPFCVRYLFGATTVEALLHLAPCSMVYRPLREAWQALDTHDALLVPSRLAPSRDGDAAARGARGEGLYQSGLFGVRRSMAAGPVLGWWSQRAYDLVAGGGDGNPLDLMPTWVDALRILRDPSYGVRGANLDERILSASGGDVQVQGHLLATFEFTGYDPARPDRFFALGRTQRLDRGTAVEMLCQRYGSDLQASGERAAPQPRRQLGNGIAVVPAMATVLQKCMRDGIALPSPMLDPDGFCMFLATPNPSVFGVDVAPLVTVLLQRRPDVAAAYPGARTDKDDPGFRAWLSGGGATEEQMQGWVARFGAHLTQAGGAAPSLEPRDAGAGLSPHPAPRPVRGMVRGWLGRADLAPTPGGDQARAELAESGFARVLDAYFSRMDLLSRHPLPYLDDAIAVLANRLREVLFEFPGLHPGDVDAFAQLAAERRNDLALACLRYNPYVRDQIGGLPSALNLRRIHDFLVGQGAGGALPHVTSALLSGEWIDPVLQFRAFCEGDARVRQLFPEAALSPAEALACAYFVLDRHAYRTSHREWQGWAHRVLQGCRAPGRPGVNLAGYLRSTTGMGESARSMARTLAGADVEHSLAVVPSGFHDPGIPLPGLPSMFGGIVPELDVNLVVANADDLLRMRDWLPQDVWHGRRNVGYWVWETETAPARFVDATRGLDAVWTPSTYSAAAIRAAVDVPVAVVPHLPDFEALDAARPIRSAFGLPAETLLFGYFFDAKSELERKNPGALINAFRHAFGDRRDVGLVLKVSSPQRGSYAFEALKASAVGLNVTWIEHSLARAQSCDLMASLDVYVSLHRAEGFGLTMAEAMAIGKPVIATGYSGNLDFMDIHSAWLVDHAVVSTPCPHGPYPAGSRWSEPSVAHAAELMRGAENPARREALGAAARRHLRDVLGPATVARRANEALAALRADSHPSTRPARPAGRA